MRRMVLYTLISIAFFVTAAIHHSCRAAVDSDAVMDARSSVILIDPGHGGIDGGASAADGTLEKHINLAIGTDLYELFLLWGYPVQSTRLTDISVHDEGAGGTRQIKVSDMRNRLSMYENAQLIISIHQNHFSIEKYNGAQVFYSAADPQSLELATAVRASIIGNVQPYNTRELKRATDGIYLLHHTTRPAILVECGFLSNTQEREMLKDDSYQQRLAFSIFAGYWEYEKTNGEE